MKKKILFVGVLACSFASTTLFAQKNETQKEKKEKVETLDEVVVTATKFNLKKENSNSSSLEHQNKENFKNENLKIDYKDYYFSNVIARSSKTMLDCHNSKLKIKRTGTDG